MKRIFSVLVFFLAVALTLTSCTQTSSATDYFYGSYWDKDNEIRILCDISVQVFDDYDGYVEVSYTPSQENLELFETLNAYIIEFFSEAYDEDVQERISSMTVNYFSTEMLFDFIAGYTIKNSSGINLNILLFTDPEYSYYLASAYLHESMHYLGVTSDVLSPIDEGITEFLAIKCANMFDLEYFSTETYAYCLSVAAQMCAVNENEIVSSYLNDKHFDISKHITSVLKDVPQPYKKIKDIGPVFSTLVGNLGLSYDDTSYILAFIAQDILAAYCKEFNPTKSQIETIRSFYFVDRFEELRVTATDYGYELS